MARQPAPPTPAAPLLLLGALLFVSGGAGLVDELVWTRWLTLGLGSSNVAAVIVLATFMAGLGIGSALGGRAGDRYAARGIRLFALVEALVGAWGLISIPLLSMGLPAGAAALARAAGAATLPGALRVGLAALALLPPTILMGATLPILARWIVSAGIAPGRGIGALYTLNTLGGAVATLVAGFVMIERLGLARTAIVAAAAELAVAAAAWMVAGRFAPAEASPPGRTPRVAVAAAAAARPGGGPILAAAGLAALVSGLVGLGTEVAFHRVLAVLAGSSAYAFAAMLGAYLFGIAGGSALGMRLADRARDPGRALALALAGLALGTSVTLQLLEAGAWQAAGKVAAALPGLSAWSYSFELGGCLAVLLPTTVALGIVIPLVARVTAAVPEGAGARFGGAYALNTLGAVLGAAGTGLVLVPSLGTARAMTVLAALAALGGIAVAALALPGRERARTLAAAAVLGAIGVAAGFGADPARHALLARFARLPVLAYDEGPVQTIAVIEESNDQQLDFLRLVTNQISLTGTHLYAQRYMRLLGHLPAAWAREPKRALVIAFGTGMTTGAIATHPEIEQIDVAEISPEVVAAAPLFRTANGDVLADPRVRMIVDDGRHVLLAGREPWDVITLEPPPPRDSGVVSLYTRDFYELALSRLAPGGVVAQWIPLHSQSDAEVKMLVRSFAEAFPHALGFLPVERDLLLLGSREPLAIDPAQLARRIEAPPVRASLAAIGFDSAASLLAPAILDRAGLLGFAGDAPVVTDDRPLVEYFARYGRRPGLPNLDALVQRPLPLAQLVKGPLPPGFDAEFDAARSALGFYLQGAYAHEARRAEQGVRLSLQAVAAAPGNRFYLWGAGISDEHLARLAKRAEAGQGGSQAWIALGQRLAARGREAEARAAFARGGLSPR
jgi:spermidine synthase